MGSLARWVPSRVMLGNLIGNNRYARAQRNLLSETRIHRLEPMALPFCPSRFSSTIDENLSWKVNMLYDSECPLCMHEVRFLQKRDKKNLVKFTDICALDYDHESNGHVTYEEGMKKIHAVLSDGTVVKGLKVFEKVYGAVGLGWVYSFSKFPLLFRFGERVYDYWALKRMWLTGRPELEKVFEERKKTLQHLRNSQKLEEKVCDAK